MAEDEVRGTLLRSVKTRNDSCVNKECNRRNRGRSNRWRGRRRFSYELNYTIGTGGKVQALIVVLQISRLVGTEMFEVNHAGPTVGFTSTFRFTHTPPPVGLPPADPYTCEALVISTLTDVREVDVPLGEINTNRPKKRGAKFRL